MAKKFTSYTVTTGLQNLERKLMQKTRLKQTQIHENAILDINFKNFKILPALLVTSRKSPDYITRDAIEHVYLTGEMEQIITHAAERNGCSQSTVFFQALMDYVTGELARLNHEN